MLEPETPPVRASGARRFGFPWILIIVGIAAAYALTEERK
jgi:hypothetical protein